MHGTSQTFLLFFSLHCAIFYLLYTLIQILSTHALCRTTVCHRISELDLVPARWIYVCRHRAESRPQTGADVFHQSQKGDTQHGTTQDKHLLSVTKSYTMCYAVVSCHLAITATPCEEAPIRRLRMVEAMQYRRHHSASPAFG